MHIYAHSTLITRAVTTNAWSEQTILKRTITVAEPASKPGEFTLRASEQALY